MDAVELSFQALSRCDEIFAKNHMWENVRAAMFPMIEQSNDIRDAIVVDDETAAKFVVSVLARYVERQLATGNFHCHRGTLGIHGQNLREIAETALRYLEEHKAISHDSYLMKMKHLNEVVSTASRSQNIAPTGRADVAGS
ncbi:hypothetical protein SAMN05428974_3814 [Sphingopyxis sp. YR583]|uniref:hypothetical protein n=1 Tax=Sphingopyxis sp. YR583 TaxID=1881047 RepID=UPI0008A7783E|nr:hypothetical protein [Sphingopyxis sp. YR583]SEH20062.1 hypothetical protein SAMN05428974_3814 [Sphingopyxis sp. YR583]